MLPPTMSFLLRSQRGLLALGLSASVFSACGPENAGPDGNSGGSNSLPSGGALGSGGTSSGGALSTGGSQNSGGQSSGGQGSGGISASGGAAGVGGGTNAGGTSSGGQAGVGGGSPAGGATGDGGGSTGGAASTCPEAQPLTGGQQYCSNSVGNAGNGYSYELWAEGNGTGCMRVHGVDAAFSAEWNDVEDFLARAGLSFNQTQTHQQIGTISAEFAETKTEEPSEDGLTYIGIYGWTVEPLREFYILDDWGAKKPGGFSSDGTPRDEVGTITVDGEIYDVWKKTRVNKPAITGNSATFDQYFSIRRTARQCGTISVSEHFTKWEGLGLQLGKFHEVKLLLEAQFNSGSIAFTTAKVTAD